MENTNAYMYKPVYERNEIYMVNQGTQKKENFVPMIIVSSIMINDPSNHVVAIPIVEKESRKLPTHVMINYEKCKGIAICEKLQLITQSQISEEYLAVLSDEQVKELNAKICISLEMGVDKQLQDSILKVFLKEYEKASKKEEKILQEKVKQKTQELQDTCNAKIEELKNKNEEKIKDLKEKHEKELKEKDNSTLELLENMENEKKESLKQIEDDKKELEQSLKSANMELEKSKNEVDELKKNLKTEKTISNKTISCKTDELNKALEEVQKYKELIDQMTLTKNGLIEENKKANKKIVTLEKQLETFENKPQKEVVIQTDNTESKLLKINLKMAENDAKEWRNKCQKLLQTLVEHNIDIDLTEI